MKKIKHNFIVCSGDTDSIAFSKADKKKITPEERVKLLAEINSLMPKGIVWEDDDFFIKFIVVKAKNYIMKSEDKSVKIKGSGLKGSKKEQIFQQYTKEVIELLLKGKFDLIIFLYFDYIKKIHSLSDVSDIAPWCFKVTATKSVIKTKDQTAFNKKIRDCILDNKVDLVEGDKYYFFYKTKTDVELREFYKGKIDKKVLFRKLHDTTKVFSSLFNTELFPKLHIKRNEKLLANIIDIKPLKK